MLFPQVEACSDAWVYLYGSKDQLSYYFRIGANANTVTQLLRGNGSVITEVSSPGILSCFEPQLFWISWADDKLQLAPESEAGPRIIDWSEQPLQPVYFVALSSDVTARWMFSREIGKSCLTSCGRYLLLFISIACCFRY